MNESKSEEKTTSPATLYDQIWDRYADAAEFVTRIRARMDEYGISQGRLARKSGFHEPHVSRWIGPNSQTRVEPTMETMVTLDEALDILVAEEEAKRARDGGR